MMKRLSLPAAKRRVCGRWRCWAGSDEPVLPSPDVLERLVSDFETWAVMLVPPE
jgi:hypothetical protein